MRLLAALAHGRAQVHVEYVQDVAAQADIGPQRHALLACPDGNVDRADQLEVPAAERHVSVGAAAVLARLAHRAEQAQTPGQDNRPDDPRT